MPVATGKRRPLLTLQTPLGKIPKEWLEIEPKIARFPEKTTCWVWVGALDNDGHPVVSVRNPKTGKRNTMRVARIVANIFWFLKPHAEVVHVCGATNCLNPGHFYLSVKHWHQEDRPAMMRRRSAYEKAAIRERRQKIQAEGLESTIQ